MTKNLITIVLIVALTIMGFGCKKTSDDDAPPPIEVKSQAEYDEQAKKEVSTENMQAELDNIEKELQQETSGGY